MAIPRGAETLAAALVGRTRAGDPLVPLEQRAIPGIGSHAEGSSPRISSRSTHDPAGVSAARSARTSAARTRGTATTPAARPAWPRLIAHRWASAAEGFRDDLMSSVRFHRILRRGREYGPGLSPEDALAPGAAGRAGARAALHLPQREHLASVRVPAERLDDEHEVLRTDGGERSAARQPRARSPGARPRTSSSFRRTAGLAPQLSGLPQFVTVRGGEYFFLPGLRALRYLVGGGDA